MTESELRAEMGRAGGIARAAKMSKKARRESAMKANRARWAKGDVKGNSRDRRTARRAAK